MARRCGWQRRGAIGAASADADDSFACAFSPDGQQLLYSRIVEGFNQLFVLDLTTRRDRALTHSGSHKYQGAWSPDGRWIAFSANTGGTVHVWRIPAAGGREEQLTNGAERYMHMFYSPDGRWLYVQPSHRNIYRMPANGGPLRPVTRFPESGPLPRRTNDRTGRTVSRV